MNPYALPSLVSAIVALSLGIYVLFKNPKSKVNITFSILAFFATTWFLIEFITYFVPLGTVEQLINLEWICRVFVVAFFLNFALVFPRDRKILTHKWGYLLIFAPAVVMSILIYGYMRGIETFYWGFAPSLTIPVMLYIVYFFVYLSVALYLFIKAYRNPESSIEKNQVRWLLYGSAPVIIYNLACAVILLLKVYPGPELNNVLITVAIGLYSVGIVRYKLFVFSPMAGFIVPTPEAQLKTKLKYKLIGGRSYLIKKPERGPEIFKERVTHDIPGLWITTLQPDKIRKKYRLTRTPILYLGSMRMSGEVVAPPDELDKAIDSTCAYVLAERLRPIVFLDCFKTLVVVNGFEKAINTLKKMSKLCARNKSNLLVQIDQTEFSKGQLATIEKAIAPS